jgi:hypothetical protein
MAPKVKALLESFDALSESERQEAAVEILHRIAPAGAELSDQVLIGVADDVFAALDAEESETVNANRQEGCGLDR